MCALEHVYAIRQHLVVAGRWRAFTGHVRLDIDSVGPAHGREIVEGRVAVIGGDCDRTYRDRPAAISPSTRPGVGGPGAADDGESRNYRKQRRKPVRVARCASRDGSPSRHISDPIAKHPGSCAPFVADLRCSASRQHLSQLELLNSGAVSKNLGLRYVMAGRNDPAPAARRAETDEHVSQSAA